MTQNGYWTSETRILNMLNMVVFRSLFSLLAFLSITSAVITKNVTILCVPCTSNPEMSTTTTSTTAKPSPSPPNLPEGYIHFPDINTAYKIYDYSVKWHRAEQLCNFEGAYLAVLDTWTKVHYIKSRQLALQWIWTGIYRQSSDSNNWRTVNGGILPSNLPWANLSYSDVLGNCVTVSGVADGLGISPCDQLGMFVCEMPDVE